MEHGKAALSGDDWLKLLLVLAGIYYALKIITVFR